MPPEVIASAVRFTNGAQCSARRSVHLAVDVWCEAGTPVFAPLEGTVHSFRDDASYGDYGPTIILQHEIEELAFHTLYGHLLRSSIGRVSKGQKIESRGRVGSIEDAEVNGGWPPHLHFQVIFDMQGYEGDYPGVAAPASEATFALNCPNHNLILQMAELY